MIKLNTIGMYDVAKVNAVVTSQSAVKNYSIIAVDGIDYLIANELNGDDWAKEDIEFAAGEYLDGYDLKAFEGQELVVDAKHIKFGVGETYASSITAGTTLFTVDSTTHKLQIVAQAPQSGLYFKATAKCRLTEEAIKAKVLYK